MVPDKDRVGGLLGAFLAFQWWERGYKLKEEIYRDTWYIFHILKEEGTIRKTFLNLCYKLYSSSSFTSF